MSERYYFRLIDHPQVLGPEAISVIRAHTKGIPDRYEAVPAVGQTYSQLRKTKEWVRVDSLLSTVSDEIVLPTINASTHCHVFCAGQQLGPYIPQQIETMWSAGALTADASVFPAGYPDWVPISDFLTRVRRDNSLSEVDVLQHENPDLFGVAVFLTVLFPIVGLIAGIRWLCHPSHRGAGGSILAIALILMFIYSIIYSFFLAESI
jgi:hypothetical protein